jgi:hypothetical protein
VERERGEPSTSISIHAEHTIEFMKYRAAAAALLLATALFAAVPKPVAPDAIAHSDAMFLSLLSGGGARRVTFKATAIGTYFFLEESAGVTVYVYDGVGYQRVKFLKGATLQKAVKAYAKNTAAKR